MNLRSVFLLGGLVLGPGCAPRELQPYLGTYAASGESTLTLFGSSVVQPRSETIRVTEGSRTDLVFSNGKGCTLPAELEDSVAVLVPETTCRVTVTLPDATAMTTTLVVTEGTATRTGERITLRYVGTANVIYADSPFMADVSVVLTLTEGDS